MKKKWLIMILFCLIAGVPSLFAKNHYLEFVVRYAEKNYEEELQRVGVVVKENQDFSIEGKTSEVKGENQGEQGSFSGEGTLKLENNQLLVTFEGNYSYYFGTKEEGFDVSGSFTASLEVESNKEILIHHYTINEPEKGKESQETIKIYLILK